MITDASDFRPLAPRRLVPAGPRVAMAGPGTRFRAGELVDESDAPVLRATLVQVVQLARKR